MRQTNEQKFKSAKVLCMRKNRFTVPDLQLKPIGLAIQTRRLKGTGIAKLSPGAIRCRKALPGKHFKIV
jgi:hypothetical protein